MNLFENLQNMNESNIDNSITREEMIEFIKTDWDAEEALDYVFSMLDDKTVEELYLNMKEYIEFNPNKFEAMIIKDEKDIEQVIESTELKPMSGTDILAWQGANDFADGSKPLIAYGDGGTLIVSGSDENDGSALISIYYGPDGDQWAWKSYDSKEAAIKDARILVKLIDDEVDTKQLNRFGFEW